MARQCTSPTPNHLFSNIDADTNATKEANTNTIHMYTQCFGHLFGKSKKDYEAVMFSTKQGKEIEAMTLSSVKSLMRDMDKQGVTKEDFKMLKQILQENKRIGAPEEEWFSTVRQFASTRQYTSHQGVELLQIMKEVNPFELIELACFLYDNLLNRDSFQMLLNVFNEEADRCYRHMCVCARARASVCVCVASEREDAGQLITHTHARTPTQGQHHPSIEIVKPARAPG